MCTGQDSSDLDYMDTISLSRWLLQSRIIFKLFKFFLYQIQVSFFKIAFLNVTLILHVYLLQISCESTTMRLLQVFKDFAANTSIHGLTFLVQHQLSLGRRVCWALIFIAALIYAGRQLNISVICMFRLIMLRITHLSLSQIIGIQLYIKNETCPKKRNLKNFFYVCHVTKNETCERTA